jgi:hypothetical protein
MSKGISEKKIIAFFLIATLGMTVLQVNHFMEPASAQSNSWYLGKGVKPNTYFTYEIKSADTNQGQPFLITLYFKEYNSTGKYWVVPTFVVDQGTVHNGTLYLSDLDMTALGSSPIPQDMAEYRGAYATTLDWLAAYVPKPGQSLGAASWGKIAAIGGSEIKPSGTAKVTTPAGTFDTTVIAYYKGITNSIYLDPNLPFPVKAQTYADVTTGTPPTQYAYELKSMGTGEPAIPKTQVEIPKPPLTLLTPRGSYNLQLLWDPIDIKAGQVTHFGVIFTDDKNNIVPRVTYGFKVTDQDKKVLTNLDDQRAPDGTGKVDYTFKSPGPKHIQVTVQTANGESLDMFVESATFDVVVS